MQEPEWKHREHQRPGQYAGERNRSARACGKFQLLLHGLIGSALLAQSVEDLPWHSAGINRGRHHENYEAGGGPERDDEAPLIKRAANRSPCHRPAEAKPKREHRGRQEAEESWPIIDRPVERSEGEGKERRGDVAEHKPNGQSADSGRLGGHVALMLLGTNAAVKQFGGRAINRMALAAPYRPGLRSNRPWSKPPL